MIPRSRNLVTLIVPQDLVLALLQGLTQLHQVWVPNFESLPADAEILKVGFDEFGSNNFMLLAWHPSFPLVPDGEEVPKWDGSRGGVKFVGKVKIDYVSPSEMIEARFDKPIRPIIMPSGKE